MEAGGGFVGIHDAARAEPYSDWFTGLIGARPAAASPTAVQRATVEVGDRQHPATKEPADAVEAARQVAELGDEPLRRRAHRGPGARVAPTQPGAGANGWDHPVSWCRDYDGGRSFYTGMGGTAAVLRTRPTSASHLRGALLWTTRPRRGRLQGDDRRQLQGRAPTAAQPAAARATRSASRTAWSTARRAACSTSAAAAPTPPSPWSPTGTTRPSARARARSTSTTRRTGKVTLAGRARPSSATRAAATS